MRLPIHAGRVFDRPLMIDRRKAEVILRAVGHKFEPNGGVIIQNSITVQAGTIGDDLGNSLEEQGRGNELAPFVAHGVAKIDIEGTLVHKGKWIGMDSGETSYEGIQAQVLKAMRDPSIMGVIFEVDSTGGEVSGAFETAEMIRELSAQKPTVAILTDEALSAGYLLASQARKVIAPANGYAGSVGVMTVHIDRSQQIADAGIKVTLLHAGAHKVEGNPYEPLPKDVADAVTAELEKLREMFAGFVAAGRGGRMSKEQVLATEAQVYIAEDAMKIGLIDAVASPSMAAAQFVKALA